ncbi:uncharacterized protein N7484_000134 [Penicillium longicatenatum]|uniref:uncharacterized protein n=1 Tax=Penicillium longicatenatum TaxID=1561947 RepID=UPI002546CFB3|nr:uncharacterized protein N7484_000134 [Penicillium longicatenatum]KAJ5660762.1 hypothetical protein N7484_000134 [Penicillium longicatenatum]
MGHQPLPQERRSLWEDPSGTTELETNKPSNLDPALQGDQNSMILSGQLEEPSNCRSRRFLAQPIETSFRSSNITPTRSNPENRDNSDTAHDLSHKIEPQIKDQTRRRILPTPIETTIASRHGPTRPQEKNQSPIASGPRRFKPDLIETDRRSVKGMLGESSHINAQNLKTERLDPAPRLSPRRNTTPHPTESKFSYASLLRRQETRRHSFRVPDLPSIPSNSSEGSEGSAGSPLASSPTNRPQRGTDGNMHALLRESYDGDFSEYLLSLAARSAQKQLKEQALAAFPNEQVYEPVDHFAIDEDEDDSEDQNSMYPSKHHLKSRRQSSADLSWELEYMRQHKEEAEQRLRAMGTSGKPKPAPTEPKPEPKNLGPSPPMLGGDIVLPWSLSPDGTLCENTSTNNDSQTVEDRCSGCGGLWCEESQADGGRVVGLWMGTCRKADGPERQSHLISGIMTPMIQDYEIELSPSPRPNGPSSQYNETGPSSSQHGVSPILPQNPDDEFHDGFVTQIYNYLSLGYPCVARYYDYELGRISGITVEDLRRDDLQTDARGYVVAPGNKNVEACMRWKALRLYIREWARQQPSMVEDENGLEAWGVPERRGSWAI